MTPEEVIKRVADIAEAAGDDERAHILEDELWRDVLQAIINNKTHAQEMARIALSTQAIQFSRWCA